MEEYIYHDLCKIQEYTRNVIKFLYEFLKDANNHCKCCVFKDISLYNEVAYYQQCRQYIESGMPYGPVIIGTYTDIMDRFVGQYRQVVIDTLAKQIGGDSIWISYETVNKASVLLQNLPNEDLTDHTHILGLAMSNAMLYFLRIYKRILGWIESGCTVDCSHFEGIDELCTALGGGDLLDTQKFFADTNVETKTNERYAKIKRTHAIAAVKMLINKSGLCRNIDETKIAEFVEAVTGGNIEIKGKDTVSYKKPTTEAKNAAVELLKIIGIE